MKKIHKLVTIYALNGWPFQSVVCCNLTADTASERWAKVTCKRCLAKKRKP